MSKNISVWSDMHLAFKMWTWGISLLKINMPMFVTYTVYILFRVFLKNKGVQSILITVPCSNASTEPLGGGRGKRTAHAKPGAGRGRREHGDRRYHGKTLQTLDRLRGAAAKCPPEGGMGESQPCAEFGAPCGCPLAACGLCSAVLQGSCDRRWNRMWKNHTNSPLPTGGMGERRQRSRV